MGNGADYIVDVQLQRSTHEEALNELFVVLQQLGYTCLEATVTEWVDNAIVGFVLGGVGGGVAGASSRDGALGVLLALAGSVAGALVGSFIDSAKVVYLVRRTRAGWQLTPAEPPSVPAARLGLA